MSWYKNGLKPDSLFETIEHRQNRQFIISLIVFDLFIVLFAVWKWFGDADSLFAIVVLIYLMLSTPIVWWYISGQLERAASSMNLFFHAVLFFHLLFFAPSGLASPTSFFLFALLPFRIRHLNQRQVYMQVLTSIVVLVLIFIAEHSGFALYRQSPPMEPFHFFLFLTTYMVTALNYGRILILQGDETTIAKREMLEAYQTIYERLPIGVYRSSVDGKQVRANRTLVELNGYKTEQEQLDGVKDIAREWYVDPRRRDQFKQILEENGVVFGFESEIYRHKSRERIWITETAYAVRDESGAIQYYEGTVQDITERKQAEDAEKLASEKLRLITSNLPALAMYMDAETHIQFASKQFLTGLGQPLEAIIGRKLSDVLGNLGDKAARNARIERVLRGETFEFEMPLFSLKEGEKRYGFGRYVPHIHDDEIIGFYIAILDITKEKQAEEAMRQGQKMKSLGLLAGGIAHDFNNLLAVIIGQVSLLIMKTPDDAKQQKNLRQVEKAAQKAAELCQQLLAYSGHGHIEETTLDINQMIAENVHLFEVAMPPNVTLRHYLQADLPLIRADSTQIQQVVMNLIINGADATDGHGEVMVRTQTRMITGDEIRFWAYTLAPLSPGEYLSVTVQDNGSGIDPEMLQQIFDPFFSTKESGHGLGLSAVLGIIRGHQGGLHVDSRPGIGSMFEILFPLVGTAALSASSSHLPTAQVDSIATTVLVIDDDPAVRSSICDMLTSGGHHIIAVDNGEDGIKRLQILQKKIGLIVLDLTMRGLSGKETLFRLRAIDPDVPIILSSGYHRSDAEDDTNDIRANSFLQKPYDVQTLLDTVQKHKR